jgi:hypothetical protein
MRLFLTLLIVLAAQLAPAQRFASEFWHAGKMVLDTGDTLRGNLKYDMTADILQLQIEKRLESYTARKVLFFEIFDETVSRYRIFYSLPYAQAGLYKAPVFFELLQEGKLTVLCRESIEYRTTSSPYFYGSYSRLVEVNKYFILKEDGTITEYKGKKNDWYDLMPNKKSEVERFAKDNRLSLEEKYELSRVIEYYNSLYQKR